MRSRSSKSFHVGRSFAILEMLFRGRIPPNGAQLYIDEIALPAMKRGEEFHWTLRLKSEPQSIVGVISLKESRSDHRGFWLGLPWQGQGLMSEAAAWANEFWFKTRGHSVLRVDKAVRNHASRRISEKQGMRLVSMQEKDYVAGRLPSETWEITADEWRTRNRVAVTGTFNR